VPLPFSARTVLLDDAAQRFVDRSREKYERFEDHWRGITWRLARSPEKGIPRDPLKPDQYLNIVIPANLIAGTVEIWLLYSYTENETCIHRALFGDGPSLN